MSILAFSCDSEVLCNVCAGGAESAAPLLKEELESVCFDGLSCDGCRCVLVPPPPREQDEVSYD